MTPAPAARTLVGSVLALGALAAVTACSALSAPPTARKADITPPSSAPATSAAPSPAGLTQAQARAALVTEADLGEPWAPTQGAATWHDGLLKATAEKPECRRLLDALYAEELFGADTRPRAAVGLDDVWNGSQLRYQVVTHRPADVERSLAWLRTLPRKCAQFAATSAQGKVTDVYVADAGLPEVGDARQGLRIAVVGATLNGEPVVLTLDVAVVRVGDDAIGLTHGGLGDVSADVTRAALDLGARRLAEVHKQGRAQI
ncbi:hypothetical protein [Streptomyces sp. ALI-76-A]|jgi:hypothetical protein|uniref:hypothetical protein n=1 Tax=Streptomyces sp. ALI-76-A TaxID=3025736 RepID=UPI00256EDF01|nr:hypothetical protein [Streptomyces sp. ALI-76-A]MDL5202736.1 hypothetical protein [Streptomyces sp. ALI-76-A]